MKLTLPGAAALVILLFIVPAGAQWVDERQPARDSLKGLSGIVVSTNLGSTDSLPDDPTERELQESVEKRLRDSGISVLKRPYGTSDNSPTLVVSLSFMNFDIFYYHLSAFVTLRQEVKLPRDPSLKITAATWEWGSTTFAAGYSKRDQIAEVIDKFICDFRQANPNIKGPSPDCHERDIGLKSCEPERKRPRVMTALEDQLIRAAALNEVNDVKSLLVKGADVNAHDHADSTPLSYAVRSGSRRRGDIAVIGLLLQHGANPNVSMACRLTPLMNAVNRYDLRVAQILLDHGANVNAATPEGYTALMSAAALGYPDSVSLLLKKGANPRALTRDGQTALALAQVNRNRIAPYDRPSLDEPTISIPEAELLKQAQNKHDQVIKLLENAGSTRLKNRHST
jgi:hypothetical protein